MTRSYSKCMVNFCFLFPKQLYHFILYQHMSCSHAIPLPIVSQLGLFNFSHLKSDTVASYYDFNLLNDYQVPV